MNAPYVDHGHRHKQGGSDPIPNDSFVTYQVKIVADGTTFAVGGGTVNEFFIPEDVNGLHLVKVAAGVSVPGSTATVVQITNLTQAVDMLTTSVSIDSGDYTSFDAATPPVIDTGSDQVFSGDRILFDITSAGTDAEGLSVALSFDSLPGGVGAIGPIGPAGPTGPTGPAGGPIDGWQSAEETWTYFSADGPTGVFTVAADVTTKYSVGMRVRYVQTTTKYGIITNVSTFSGGNTTITIYGGTDYTTANAAISSNYYAQGKAPFGFPLDPTKWTVEITDTSNRSQATPTNGTWYNLGSVSISVPIGVWYLSYTVVAAADRSGAATGVDAFVTLSTANNTEADKAMTGVTLSADASASGKGSYGTITRQKVVALTAKTSYYLNTSSDFSVTTIYNRNDLGTLVIRAVSVYL